MADFDDDENGFNKSEIKKSVEQVLDNTLGKTDYKAAEVPVWSTKIVNDVLENLQRLNKPFKYIVTAVIMQNNGAGIHSASSCYWDEKTDGQCVVKFESSTMYCIATVFALRI